MSSYTSKPPSSGGTTGAREALPAVAGGAGAGSAGASGVRAGIAVRGARGETRARGRWRAPHGGNHHGILANLEAVERVRAAAGAGAGAALAAAAASGSKHVSS